MDLLAEDRLRPIALSKTKHQVFDGSHPIDRFSPLQQEDSYSGPPPPAKAKSSPYNDEPEPGFSSGQKIASFMTILGRGIPHGSSGGTFTNSR